MSWGRVDDRMPEHPKWAALEREHGPRVWADAMAVWAVVLCYANRNETDGAIEETLLARSTPLGRGAVKAAEAMVSVRLMDRTEHGFRLHDFLSYNPSAEKKKAERAADSARKAASKSAPSPTGIRPESERSPAVAVPDSAPPTRARAPALTPASRPVPSRPDPMEISHERSSVDQVGRDSTTLPALGRVLDGFKRRWQAKLDASGSRLGDMWPGALEHRGRADAIAIEFASDPAALEASLDGYFASDDPFVSKPSVRWNFKTWANDPRRWISARTEPQVDMAALTARIPRAQITDANDEMALPPRRRA